MDFACLLGAFLLALDKLKVKIEVMAITVDRIFEEALCLSGDSRVALAERLLESVVPDKAIFEAQLLVATRRADELDSGAAQGVSGKEALDRVRASILNRSLA